MRREAPPALVAEYLCRQAGVRPARIHPGADDWLTSLAEELAQHAQGWRPIDFDRTASRVADEAIRTLRPWVAPSVLAVIAQDQVVGGCAASQLPTACKALVRRHLPWFCRRVLACWRDDGHITETADGPDDPPGGAPAGA